jgi:hypothetical protein
MKVSAKMVPKNLSSKKKIEQLNLLRPFSKISGGGTRNLKKITNYETWVKYNPETKCQTFQD